MSYQFPQGFLWGCANAAHQVEGDNHNDWSLWEQTPGHVFHDEPSGAACEWWAGRYLEDFDRAATMHNNAQRISVEWSRIEPEPGLWDNAALERYRDMLKALIARGMTPIVTLHHFSNPLWIGVRQGWLWDEAPTYFERFVHKVVGVLGDLCTLWCTINEPLIYTGGGYTLGAWPPGFKDSAAASRVVVNLLKGHAAAYYAIKALQPESQVGFASHYIGIKPFAPKSVNWVASYITDFIINRSFAQALITGAIWLPNLQRITVPKIKGTLDWVGVQYYQQQRAGFDLKNPESRYVTLRKPDDLPVGPGLWGGLSPEGIFDAIQVLWKITQKPIYVTECGVPDPTDAIRPGYLLKSIQATYQAFSLGIPVRGFFVWTLLDNIEWAEGRNPEFSFGLYHTDFATQVRTARPSAELYGEICARNGIPMELLARYGQPVQDNIGT